MTTTMAMMTKQGILLMTMMEMTMMKMTMLKIKMSMKMMTMTKKLMVTMSLNSLKTWHYLEEIKQTPG